MREDGRTGVQPRRTSGLVIALLWLTWLFVPPLLVFGAGITAAPFFGDQPDAAELAHARTLLIWAGVVGVGAPLLGLVLTWRTRRAAAWAFAAALGVGAIAVLLTVPPDVWRGGEPVRDDGGRVCQESSGGDNRCPGG
jgi:hypothetical protein